LQGGGADTKRAGGKEGKGNRRAGILLIENGKWKMENCFGFYFPSPTVFLSGRGVVVYER